MARQATTPTGLRFAAIAMAMGGLTIGIGMPVLFALMQIRTIEIAPGIDLTMVAFPAVAIVDLVMAYVLWHRAGPRDPQGGGPVVG